MHFILVIIVALICFGVFVEIAKKILPIIFIIWIVILLARYLQW